MDGLEWSQFLLGSNTQLEGDTLNLNSPLNAIYKKIQDSWQSVQSIWKSKQSLFLFLKICVAILENNCTPITQWTTEKQGSELLADTHRQLVIVACWVSRVKYDDQFDVERLRGEASKDPCWHAARCCLAHCVCHACIQLKKLKNYA